MLSVLVLDSLPLDHIELSCQEQGAPFLDGHPEIEISLSHSNDYTAAACSTNIGQAIGIDVEKISKKPDQAFLKTAFTENEIAQMPDDAAQIFKYWTIKEAFLKYIKKGFNESLHKAEIIDDHIYHHKKKVDVDIYSTRIQNDYILSLVSGSLDTESSTR